ncbi:MAG: hypothetical protein LVS60_05480 [Nodosilinea sp. LVE1205-7]|jgi:hypothetical protein
MLPQVSLPPTPPAIVAPIAESSRDEFPKCRAAGGGGPVVYTCKQTKTYALLLERPMVDPEHGPMVEEFTTEVTITAGYIPGEGGDVARLRALFASDGWTITALLDTAEPDVEF